MRLIKHIMQILVFTTELLYAYNMLKNIVDLKQNVSFLVLMKWLTQEMKEKNICPVKTKEVPEKSDTFLKWPRSIKKG